MRLAAFSGVRFNGDPRSVGDRAAPPYDQIGVKKRDELHRQKYQFAHLSRPVATTGDPHDAARSRYEAWNQEGVFTFDPKPSIYPYEIELPDGRRRLGICALIGLEDEASGQIRPHEYTVAKTVDERLSLLERMRVDIEPILLIAEDGGRLNPLLTADIEPDSLVADHRSEDGAAHRLYRLDDPDRIESYRAVLAQATGVIADGHHRYTVAKRFASEYHPEPDSAAEMKLMVVTSLGSSGLAIDPIHRGLKRSCDLTAIRDLAVEIVALSTEVAAEIVDAVQQAPQPALAVGPIDGRFEVWQFSETSTPEGLDANLSHLAVGWLHRALLPRLGFTRSADTDGTVLYRSDPNELLDQIREGSLTTGFWLPSMSADDFGKATAHGEILPPKSTRFLPKLVSGLVWAQHDAALG